MSVTFFKHLFSCTVIVVVLFLAAHAKIQYTKSKPIPDDANYLSSTNCQYCHEAIYNEWQNSLHAKMMRKLQVVQQQEGVQANLDLDGDIPFDPSEIVWVVGSKWEQQFMGEEIVVTEDGEEVHTETSLPGSWLIEKHEWMLQGWDGWQVPEPLKRCHGCHTVGLNIETGHFVEPSIGCESCHGPSSWHQDTKGRGKIHNGIDAKMCGQCHTRGKSIDNKHFYPVNFKPWENLEAVFVENKPDPLQNNSQWWANGHARKRHQQYFAWKQGGHSDSLKSLTENYDGRFGKVTPECLTCHAGEAAIKGKDHGLTLDQVENGITCTNCHKVHGDLHEERVTCNSCHGKGAYWHERPEEGKGLLVNHIPCPETANVQCINCHMPKTGKNGGKYSLHSHTAGIIPPSNTEKWGVPNSCANGGCHENTLQTELELAYKTFYKLDK